MRDYLLFLDTEASGLPKKWNLPYSNSSNWPSAVQISWIVYAKDGTLIKTENHYIRDNDVQIKPSAIKIHGITRDYLNRYGESRKIVMQLFADDLVKYEPLLIGHFMEFDYHVASADFYRTAIPNPFNNLPTFCTMLASSFYVRDPSVGHLRLGELYTMLFDTKLENQHNALADANATAECFFELVKRGDITDEKIDLQQSEVKGPKICKEFPWLISIFVVLVMAILLSLWV
ncbi:3'-5' exonuclease [Pedobacter sp. P351]|uniref:3'-5' exonuclease n=1 Tax=Pedobacter superstes TaxID=3133441 RepID=UPI0030A6FE86